MCRWSGCIFQTRDDEASVKTMAVEKEVDEFENILGRKFKM